MRKLVKIDLMCNIALFCWSMGLQIRSKIYRYLASSKLIPYWLLGCRCSYPIRKLPSLLLMYLKLPSYLHCKIWSFYPNTTDELLCCFTLENTTFFPYTKQSLTWILDEDCHHNTVQIHESRYKKLGLFFDQS